VLGPDRVDHIRRRQLADEQRALTELLHRFVLIVRACAIPAGTEERRVRWGPCAAQPTSCSAREKTVAEDAPPRDAGARAAPPPLDNTSVVSCFVTSNQLRRWLQRQGCTFESGRGSHVIVRRGDRMTVLPMHGSGKELGTGLVNKIKKDLNLK
jgi:mRNA interferase HicA